MNLEKQELLEINGGAIKWGIGLGILAGASFIIGLIDGIIRPLKCR